MAFNRKQKLRENIEVVFMELFLYILLLSFVGTSYIYSFETEIR